MLLLSMFFAAVSGLLQNGPVSGFRAGAAKVDVTPAASELPKTYEGILDHLYSRTIVIRNGTTKAALLTLDAGTMPDSLWQNVTKRAEGELGIPAKHILMAATHSVLSLRLKPGCAESGIASGLLDLMAETEASHQ